MSFQGKRRIFIILISITLILFILTLRLGWIQFVTVNRAVTTSGRSLEEMSVLQRERGIVLDTGRGQFVDRSGAPLTGKVIWTAILFPVSHGHHEENHYGQIAKLLGTTSEQLKRTWHSLTQPFIWTDSNTHLPLSLSFPQVQQLKKLNIAGLEVAPYVQRYDNHLSGMQWLGFVSQQPELIRSLYKKESDLEHTMPLTTEVGSAGLEKSFDPFLRGIGSTIISYTVDGKKQPMYGLGTRLIAQHNKYYPLRIKTTVDMKLQQKIEVLTERIGMKEGAIVVLDTSNSDVAAMISKPFYNPNQIDLQMGNWSNRALKAAVPGSIFKTVIAAAALEDGISSPTETFHCSGQYGKYGLACWKEGGHGDLTLAEAYAESCNVVFATLAERLGGERIEEVASQLGLGRVIGWQDNSFMGFELFKQFDHEEAGQIFAGGTPKEDDGVKVQTGIGQRDVLVTPLQAANMVVTLLQGGQIHAPRLVTEIQYNNGQTMTSFQPHLLSSPYGGISPRTANIILEMMRGVVTDGTGASLQRAKWTVAGKSGTAQVTVNGKPRNNQWFIGYGPTDHPHYAVAVLVQNRSPESSNQATLLFREVMNILASS
ncbi:penicillin-binding transpeptidase domain-containing protein [Paenibacillus sediminis]|uniref:Cell division protein FtsI/penicillin-binding protein 2 n=1 Tax=Paenibacillus sediminis TaxID=664909 RepID=A0ABS4GY43_9BACL|nr:penicillin-binding transpeptidase domain-containing protein [Paenibacillus sediminis]MBP1935192.1 cell division protein FtsI/penicillin-binding protein 2 [Paenibacillus sediminis]